jgi:putative hemolysin
MAGILGVIALTTLMIAVNALYVAAEFATVSARRTRLRQEAAAGNRMARLLTPIVDDSRRLDNYVAACQLGITASSLVLGYYGQAAIARELSPLLARLGGELAAQSLSAVIVLVLLTILQVVFGELVPKSVALRYPERVALATVAPLRWSMALFRPFIALFNGTGNLILRALGVPPASGHAHVHSPEELALLVAESAKGGLIEPDERELLSNAFRINEATAGDIMVPRTSLTAAPLSTPVPELIALATREGYSRIPLFRASIDEIAGIVHIRDLYRLHVAGQRDVGAALRSVPFVPEAKPAVDVWNQLRAERSYVAIVFDEHGGTAGMITLEDLIEEIFGELEDEFDAEPLQLIGGDPERVNLPGETAIDELNERYGLRLPDDEVRTVGGLVLAALGRAPRAGDEVTVEGAALRVEAVEGNAVARVSFARGDAGSEEAR